MSFKAQNGILQSLRAGGHTYAFRKDAQHAGPVFHVVYAGREAVGNEAHAEEEDWYSVIFWGTTLSHRLVKTRDGVRIEAKIANRSSQPFRPDRVSLELGIDTYMDAFPAWNDKVFPTMLRCEKTHLWGYFRSPNGAILGIASPDPVVSWALDYNSFFCDCGHRIYSARLDLLSLDAQPPRHPVCERVMPGEEKTWSIELFNAKDMQTLLRRASEICHAPMFAAQRLTLSEGEEGAVTIYSETKPVLAEGKAVKVSNHKWQARLPLRECGAHTLTASANGHTSELIWYVRKNWSFYIDSARNAALSMPQKTGSHAESWYGLFSGLQAARILPKPELDEKVLAKFEELLPLSFDLATGEPITIAQRIQNTAIAVSLCEDAWRVTKDAKWLDMGAKLCDFLIEKHQDAEGVFRSHATHYTCVIYIAKSILELYLAEKDIPSRKALADKHFTAAKKAVDELVRHLDNIGTEGEHTFEDGMISCSVAQISMLALLLPESERAPYILAAETMLAKHRCLERLGSVDARSRNTTLRFWEAQYDVLIPANMINSPHGWSGWKVYGVWYLYLLTGKSEYLVDTMETLGSCAQLIDTNGTLRWAFVPDPCVKAGLWKPGGEGHGQLCRCTFGETYVDMISSWYKAPENTAVFGYLGEYEGFSTDEGGCCDNDVHECFKALAETVLQYGYMYSDAGSLLAYNGTIESGQFIPAEGIVRAVHVNLDTEAEVSIRFASGTVTIPAFKRGWIYADGHTSFALPEE